MPRVCVLFDIGTQQVGRELKRLFFVKLEASAQREVEIVVMALAARGRAPGRRTAQLARPLLKRAALHRPAAQAVGGEAEAAPRVCILPNRLSTHTGTLVVGRRAQLRRPIQRQRAALRTPHHIDGAGNGPSPVSTEVPRMISMRSTCAGGRLSGFGPAVVARRPAAPRCSPAAPVDRCARWPTPTPPGHAAAPHERSPQCCAPAGPVPE